MTARPLSPPALAAYRAFYREMETCYAALRVLQRQCERPDQAPTSEAARAAWKLAGSAIRKAGRQS